VKGGQFDARIQAGITDPLPGGLWAMRIKGHTATWHLLDGYDLAFDSDRSCVDIDNPHGQVWIEACPLRRKG
jgi:hypothetical protein